MSSNDKELGEWSDEDVYYWVYEIGAGDVHEHALAIWNAAITGKKLAAMKKREFHDLFKTLDKDITSNLWREIKKLQKQGRKSIFGKRKPTPITPDYPGDAGDDSFDEDSEFDSSEEDETEISEGNIHKYVLHASTYFADGMLLVMVTNVYLQNPDMNNHSSLPERLKERLREFKAQQEELNREPQDMYIAPDADSSEQQDTYEQFSEGEDQYLTPPNEEEDAPPPPVPSRAPIQDSKHMGAPDLPPRPGPSPSRALPKINPAPIEEESDDVSVSPLVDEEYIVPDSQVDMYLPPKETDFGETYIEPMNVQPVPPKLPQGLSKPLIPSPQRPQVPVNNQSSKPYPKPSEIGKKPPLPTTTSNNDRPSSVSSRLKMFEQPPPAQPPKPAAPMGGNLWKIKSQRAANNTNSLTPPGRKVSPSPPSPKRAIAPRPAPPLPKANQRSLPVPLPPRPTPSPPVPVSSRPAVPPSSRPIQPLPRTSQPELPKPPVPQPSRPKDDVSNLSDCEWFHEVLSREEATSALQRYREDGSFVVRYSTKKPNFPYTLQLFYKGKIRNLQIGLRDDNKYALGALKEGETRFSSVRELIEYHRTHDVVLANNEGRTCLLKPVPIP